MQKIVTFFDICSSSKIIEDLAQNNDLSLWRKTLKKIEINLENKRDALGFSIYKFLGDGWVLIIDPDTDKKELLQYFTELCDAFSNHFNKTIEKRLSTEIKPIGLTFGLDIGEIFRISIGGTKEYMGSPLNIAARLQICISNPNKLEDDPSNQLMMVRRNYYKYFKDDVGGNYKLVKARRKLKNIRNDDTFICTRIWLT
jgi:hypothetical protein